MDWKDEILARRKQHQDIEDQKAEIRNTKSADEEARRKENENIEFQRKLAQHKSDFPCHISGCKNTSYGPATGRSGGRMTSFGESSAAWDSSYEYLDWGKPTGLTQCKMCSRWTCESHLLNGFCQDCYKIHGDDVYRKYSALKEKQKSRYGQPLWWQDLLSFLEGSDKIK
jgi:hypothetical protein